MLKPFFKKIFKYGLFLSVFVPVSICVPGPSLSDSSASIPPAVEPQLPEEPAESEPEPPDLLISGSPVPTTDDPVDYTTPHSKYDLMLDSVCGPLTYYNQGDIRWGEYLYGGYDRMAQYGCGPTVMAMLVTSLTGEQILPTQMADWAAANGCWCRGEGSYHCLIPDAAAAYGLEFGSMTSYSPEGIRDALNSGYLLVALMKKGHFTQQGHFIVLTQVTPEGNLKIADCNNYENTKYDWDPQLILNELNYNAKSGGPLWMIRPVSN